MVDDAYSTIQDAIKFADSRNVNANSVVNSVDFVNMRPKSGKNVIHSQVTQSLDAQRAIAIKDFTNVQTTELARA